MNNLYAIIQYTDDQPHVLYDATGLVSQNTPLLDYLDQVRKPYRGETPAKHTFTEKEQVYQVTLVPLLNDNQHEYQAVVQLTEQIQVNPDDKEFFDHVRLFFHKGAHDIKNLLNNVQMLLRKNMVDQAQKYLQELQTQYLGQIEDFYQALDQLVETEKPVAAEVETVKLGNLVASLEETILLPYGKPYSLQTPFSTSFEIRYRQDFLRSFLGTLLDNAVRYQSDDRELEITIDAEKTDEHVVIRVKDNGEGIQMEKHQKKLFQPFQRLSNKSKGQGIGLHLVKIAIEKNGGKINLDSVYGKGTTVTLFLKEL